jgi:hypothetical protein
VAPTVLFDPGRLTYRRFLELFRHMVGLRGRVTSPSQGSTYTGQHNTETQGTNIHALSRIRTQDPSNQPAKTHASDLTATVTGIKTPYNGYIDASIPTNKNGSIYVSTATHNNINTDTSIPTHCSGYIHASIPTSCNGSTDVNVRKVK